MKTLEEMKLHEFPIGRVNSDIYCWVFKGNSGTLEIAKVHKYRPRTKHIIVKYHYFCNYITRGDVTLRAIGTDYQPTVILTKPVNGNILTKKRKTIMGQ